MHLGILQSKGGKEKLFRETKHEIICFAIMFVSVWERAAHPPALNREAGPAKSDISKVLFLDIRKITNRANFAVKRFSKSHDDETTF